MPCKSIVNNKIDQNQTLHSTLITMNVCVMFFVYINKKAFQRGGGERGVPFMVTSKLTKLIISDIRGWG